jgi:hypothetical protein
VAVQARRERMAHRPAHDAREPRLARQQHRPALLS